MKTDMEKLVCSIPTHHETKAKCFEEIDNLISITNWIKSSYEDGYPGATKVFLGEAEQSIEIIRVLVGGTET